MGEADRAHDERLGRGVAVTILAEEVSQDRSRVLRFEHEARAASDAPLLTAATGGQGGLPAFQHPLWVAPAGL